MSNTSAPPPKTGVGRWIRQARYALIVSIRAPNVESDIYTPAANRFGVSVSV